jgi:uncharacterized membrane protein
VEARYNALCTFFIIINQYFFLRALEGKGIKWWIGYLFSGILCLYSSFNLWLIFIAHFIYILIYKREIFIHYIISSFLIFLGYLPWLFSIYNNLSEIKSALAWHEWYGINQNVLTLFLAQLYLAAYSFVTFNNFTTQANIFRYHQFEGNYIQLIFNILIIGLLVFSIYYTYKRTEKKVFAFILLIIVPQFLYFLITDIVRQTGISLIWRYNNLALIGFIFYLVFLFYHRLSLKQNAFAFILIVFLGLGIISNLFMSDKYYLPFFKKELANSTLLTTCEKPLLISDFKTVFAGGDAAGTLAFTNACKSDNIDILRVQSNIKNITAYLDSSKYYNFYVLHASEELIHNLRLQLGEKMDSLQIDGFVNEWQILYK